MEHYKTLIGLRYERASKLDHSLTKADAPDCIHNECFCVCKAEVVSETTKCLYKHGPNNCYLKSN